MAVIRLKHTENGFNWIDVSYPTAAELQALSAEFGLNQYTLADCL